MKKLYFSCLVLLLTNVLIAQNQPPVAVYDTVEVFSQFSTVIDVLANDLDPDGDSLILTNASAYEGVVFIENGKLVYLSTFELGSASIKYYVSDGIDSERGYVFVHVLANPDAPMAVSDTFELTNMMEHTLNVLENDFDMNNDQFKIASFENTAWNLSVSLNPDSLSFKVIPLLGTSAKFSYNITEKNTSTGYTSDMVDVTINFTQNPDIPVTNPDYAIAMGGTPVQINVLANDIDPQGDNLAVKQIFEYYNQHNGSYVNNGNSITFTPDLSFAGKTKFIYNVVEVENPIVYSDTVTVTVNVQKNPNCPVGVPDYASGMTGVEMIIDVLPNDFDPNSDGIVLKDVSKGEITSDNKIKYRSSNLALLKDSLQYRVMESANPDSWSEWTTVYIDLAVNPDLPVANPDYSSTKPGVAVTVFPLINDDLKGFDSLRIIVNTSGFPKKGYAYYLGDTVIYTPAFQSEGLDSIKYYILSEYNVLAAGKIYVNISKQQYYDSLTINNINAGVNASGLLFTKQLELPDLIMNSDIISHFKTPIDGQASTIFRNTLWVGGYDQQNKLHISTEKYIQSYDQYGIQWQSGPVSNAYDTAYLIKSARLWKISKSEIEYHRQHYNQTGYVPVEDLSSWPGNGNTANGQAAQLAPYFDLNNDGSYNCLDGDYPLIRGDQTIYFIFNDDTQRLFPIAPNMKLEVQCMVYGYNAPQDTALYNTIFVHYDLINRSGETYTDCLAGIFTDLDIGNATDDFLRCDVARGSFYAYNGDENDEFAPEYGNIKTPTYGDNPPAQSVTVLAGPFMDPDGSDNSTGCNESVNGINFGNQISDDERSGLARFIYYHRYVIGPYITDPLSSIQLYNYMKGIWDDSTTIIYGGNSHLPDANAVGPACRYMFPGDSDPLNYGTDCEFPNAGYNQGDKFWTEEEAGNEPGDRRGLGTLGPFTLSPGQVQEIDLAYVVGHGTNGVNSSVNQLLRNIDSLRTKLASGNLLIPNELLGFAPKTTNQPLLIYPNPANEVISITGLNSQSKAEYSIYNLFGTCLAKGILQSGTKPTININMLPAGMYLVKVSNGKEVSVGKFVKQ